MWSISASVSRTAATGAEGPAVELYRTGAAVVLADPSLSLTGAAVERGYVLVRGEVVAQEDGADRLDRAYQRAMGLIQKELDEVDSEVAG